MTARVGIRELRQHLSRYVERVEAGETLEVTARGRPVARLVPHSGDDDEPSRLAERLGATPPALRMGDVLAEAPAPPLPAGTTDRFLDESRR